MYSVVLATMMTLSAPAPAFCHGCWGCHGCGGNAFSHGCGGCWGCGGCYGCHGCGGCWGCHGCGGCYSPGCYAFTGCFSCYGGGGCAGCGGCHGAYTGGSGCWFGAPAAPAYHHAAPVTHGHPAPVIHGGEVMPGGGAEPIHAPMIPPVTRKGVKPSTSPALLTVTLPTESRLYVDGVLCPQGSTAVRSFDTPVLEAGKQYAYTLKVEVEEGGVTRSQSKKVLLRAGEKVAVEFAAAEVVARR